MFDRDTETAEGLGRASKNLNARLEAHGGGTFAIDEKAHEVKGFQIVTFG